MKKNDVKVGGVYAAKVSDKLTKVRIDGVSRHGGWDATNLETNKKVRIKSAQRLRGAVGGRGKKTEAPDANDENAKAAGKAATKKPKSKKADREQKPKRLSALDAAAEVLCKSDKPMRCPELITAMAERGLWSSPAGKTPHATLYAAILREIRKAVEAGKVSRFRKVERGQFALNAKAAKGE